MWALREAQDCRPTTAKDCSESAVQILVKSEKPTRSGEPGFNAGRTQELLQKGADDSPAAGQASAAAELTAPDLNQGPCQGPSWQTMA